MSSLLLIKQRSCALGSSSSIFSRASHLTLLISPLYLSIYQPLCPFNIASSSILITLLHMILSLNVLDRYGSDASYVVIQSGSVYEVIIHSLLSVSALIGLLSACLFLMSISRPLMSFPVRKKKNNRAGTVSKKKRKRAGTVSKKKRKKK